MSRTDDIHKEVDALDIEFRNSTSEHRDLIRRILGDFDTFAEKYKETWKNVAPTVVLRGTTEPAIGRVENRIADFWSDLQKIINQYKESNAYKPKVEQGMGELKKLYNDSIGEVFPAEGPPPDTLVYIKEDGVSLAKKYPFTTTFFIGISNPSGDENDWLPLAHELGHYIYWNSQFDTSDGMLIAEYDQEPIFAESIRSAIEAIPEFQSLDEITREALTILLTAWSEEIFADMVGTILRKEQYLNSSVKLFKQTIEIPNVPSIYIEDFEHPIPYLRPVVCIETLKKIENSDDARWTAYRSWVQEKFGVKFEASQTLSIGLFPRSNSGELDIPNLIAALQSVIPIMYGKFQKKDTLNNRKSGIDFIEEQIKKGLVEFYIDSAIVLERGDGEGLRRQAGNLLRRLLSLLRRKNR